MCLILIIGTFFLPAFSIDVNAKNALGALGICDIENPRYNSENGDNNPHPSEYNRVYFGWIPDTTTGKINGTSPYGDVKNVPIYWRVLNTTANDISATPALFMLTEYTLPTCVQWGDGSTGSTGSQKWSYTEGGINKTQSAIRKFLQGTSCKATYKGNILYSTDVGFYDQCFDKPEQEAIMYTTNGERLNYRTSSSGTSTNYYAQEEVNCDADGADRPYRCTTSGKKSGDGIDNNDKSYYIFCGCGLNEEKIFLLSAKEVLDTKYGFEDKYDYEYTSNSTKYYRTSRDTNRAARTLSAASGSNTYSNWWLRSAYSNYSNGVALVYSTGICGNGDSSYTGVCVRCALNIPLSSILFATNADSPSPTPSSTFTFVAPTSLSATRSTNPDSGAGSKLTIVDDVSDRRHFWVPQVKYLISKGSTESGTTITLPYRRAKTGENEYISAIIKDKKDSHRYYARLKSLPNLGDSNGTVTMTIPGDIPFGDYTLIIMNEKENGYRRTNYAKNANLRLSVDGKKVIITGNDAVGACTIRNPEYKEDGSIYDRVYFGKTPTIEDDNKQVKLLYNGNTTTGGVYLNHNTPIYWRVLNTTANDISGTPALFMLTEYCITNNMSWSNRTSNYGQCWYDKATGTTDSAIKMFLQGKSGGTYTGYGAVPYGGSAYDDCFDDKEQKVIMDTYNGEITQINTGSDSDSFDNRLNTETPNDQLLWWSQSTNPKNDDPNSLTFRTYGCGLTGEKLFLLSSKEVINESYGFVNNYTKPPINGCISPLYPGDASRIIKCVSNNGGNKNWWLRSACSDDSSRDAYVDFSGCCCGINNNDIGNTEIFVRFALNIPLSSILFTSYTNTTDASLLAESNSTPSFDPIAYNTNSGKLTRTIIAYPDNNYAQVSSADNPTTTTAITTATDSPGAKLTIVDDDRASFTIEENVIYGNKGESISIHYSGATVGTDEYISAIIKDTSGNPLYHARLKSVGTAVENSSGTLTMYVPQDIDYGDYNLIVYNELERKELNTNYAGYDTLVLTVKDLINPTVTNVYRNKLGNIFKLTASDENLSHISTLEDQEIMALTGTNATKNFQYGEGITGISIYDIAGNATTMYASDIPIDKTPPIVTVSYTNGTYTLTVSDNESGVWKITNRNGDEYCNYSHH